MAKAESKSAAEQDAVSRWGRRYLIYLGRPGVRAGLKRQMRRRYRAQARKELRRVDHAG